MGDTEYLPNSVKRYRKKPVEILALQWTGENPAEVEDFLDFDFIHYVDDSVLIATLEGDITASHGDYIVRGVSGEHYPVKPDIFKQTYEEVS